MSVMPDWARAAEVGVDTEYGRVLRKWERVNELTGENEWFVLLASLVHRRVILQSESSWGSHAEFFILQPEEVAAVAHMLAEVR